MKSDQSLIESLLAEIRYVQETGDIRDSIRNSAEVREDAAKRLGYDSYRAFGEWCDSGPKA